MTLSAVAAPKSPGVVQARRLLGETDEPIKHIARQLGYRDVFYFTRQFKQVSEVSPAAYRRSRQG